MFDSSPSQNQKGSGSAFGGSPPVQASAPANAPAPAPQAGSAGAPAGGGGGGAAGGGGNAGEAFGHFADGAGGGGGGGGPASPEEAKAQSQNKPQPKIEQAPEKGSLKNSDDKGGGAAAGGAAGEAGQEGQAGEAGKGQRTSLPADIAAAFPDGNLSNVAVYLNSKEADEQGVDGFANADEIHVASGADQQRTLRHEAAHVVQFRNGKKKIGDGAKVEPKEKNEQKAEKAEQGGSHSAASLGSAAPGEVRHKGGTKVENMNEKGVPKIVFNGTEFKSVEGEFYKDIANADWDRQYLFDKDVWWRLPVFPAAGLYVRASSYFEPTARIAWKGTYKYEAGKDGAAGKFQVGGTLEGEMSAAITGALEGGAGLNLVIQKGGVGIEAALTAQAYAKANKQINFWIDTTGKVGGIEIVPLELDFGATVKGALSAVVWTRGWFSDKVKKWTLAEWVIATLAQYKTQIAINIKNGKDGGIKPTIGAVQGGLFKWGEAPALQ